MPRVKGSRLGPSARTASEYHNLACSRPTYLLNYQSYPRAQAAADETSPGSKEEPLDMRAPSIGEAPEARTHRTSSVPLQHAACAGSASQSQPLLDGKRSARARPSTSGRNMLVLGNWVDVRRRT